MNIDGEEAGKAAIIAKLTRSLRGIKAVRHNCHRCGRLWMLLPTFENDAGDKGDSCDHCGNTSTVSANAKRLVGPRHRLWDSWLAHISFVLYWCPELEGEITASFVYHHTQEAGEAQ